MAAEPRQALDELFSLTYEELRRLAGSVRRGDPSTTLNTTSLVHEAWLKLASSPPFASSSPLHFKRIAARAMRQLLIEAARRRNAEKRGDRFVFVSLGDSRDEVPSSDKEILALDVALKELERLNPRQSVVVESKFFGGLEMAEIAELLGISKAAVERDWRAAKAWLNVELRRRG